MNRSVNLLLLALSFPAMFLVIYEGFDLTLFRLETEAAETRIIEYIFLGIAALMLLMAGRRAVYRWVGTAMLRKPERFSWSVPIGKERKKNIRLFFILEAVIALFFTLISGVLTSHAWPLTVVYGLIFIDQVAYLLIANSWFRIGISDRALVVADREINVLYFSGLRRIELHQQTIYFEYIEDLQLFFPVNAIEKSDYPAFRQALESKLNRDKVFFSEKFKDH